MPPILPAPKFEALVHAHHAEIYRSARRIVASDADALDVTQQVFLRVLEGKVAVGDARDPGRLLRWLAARTALAQLRASATRRHKEDQYAVEHAEEEPETEATRKEARAQLRRQLARLPDELRSALVLRFQEGWTFSQIASEQSCSEPSAHDRVKRGVERLRGELSRLGFAAFAVALPRELEGDLDEPAAALPEGLERRLLELRSTAMATASTKLAAGVLALASIVAVAGAAVWWPNGDRSDRTLAAEMEAVSPASESVSAPAPSTERSAATPSPSPTDVLRSTLARASPSTGERPAEFPKATLSGRIVDEDRAPIASVSVFAHSLQHAGKFARFSANAASGSDGRFTLELPVSLESGEEYALTTRHLDFVPHTKQRVIAQAGKQEDIGDLALLRSSSDEAGDSTLELLVLDPSSAPVEHAIVHALRNVIGTDGAVHEDREATGTTDVSGRVVLSLKRLGSKRLHVVPPAGELGAASVAIGIDVPGRFERTIRLERGLTITGTIQGIGGAVVHGRGGFLAAFGDPMSAWIHADVDDPSGTFVLRGLEDRTYTLVRDGDDWSRVELHGVRAGSSGLALQLKREDDLRDVGDHQAELHGEVRDARTGAVLTLQAFAVHVEYLGDLRGLDWERDVLPTMIFPRPVQTALWGEYVPPAAFHLDGLAPGTYAVSARLEGYAPAFAGPFQLGERELRTGIVIQVEAPAGLSGVLTDPQGRPLADGFVRVTGWGERSLERDEIADSELRATRGRGAIHVWDDVRTDARGRFEFKALPAWSTLRLVVHHPTFERAYSDALELRAGANTDMGRISTGPRLER